MLHSLVWSSWLISFKDCIDWCLLFIDIVNHIIARMEISPDFDPRYRDIAIEDFELLHNVIANRPGNVGNLFV